MARTKDPTLVWFNIGDEPTRLTVTGDAQIIVGRHRQKKEDGVFERKKYKPVLPVIDSNKKEMTLDLGWPGLPDFFEEQRKENDGKWHGITFTIKRTVDRDQHVSIVIQSALNSENNG